MNFPSKNKNKNRYKAANCTVEKSKQKQTNFGLNSIHKFMTTETCAIPLEKEKMVLDIPKGKFSFFLTKFFHDHSKSFLNNSRSILVKNNLWIHFIMIYFFKNQLEKNVTGEAGTTSESSQNNTNSALFCMIVNPYTSTAESYQLIDLIPLEHLIMPKTTEIEKNKGPDVVVKMSAPFYAFFLKNFGQKNEKTGELTEKDVEMKKQEEQQNGESDLSSSSSSPAETVCEKPSIAQERTQNLTIIPQNSEPVHPSTQPESFTSFSHFFFFNK